MLIAAQKAVGEKMENPMTMTPCGFVIAKIGMTRMKYTTGATRDASLALLKKAAMMPDSGIVVSENRMKMSITSSTLLRAQNVSFIMIDATKETMKSITNSMMKSLTYSVHCFRPMISIASRMRSSFSSTIRFV
ncbi:hypothetical protein ABL78_8300 [Leptomonas seymouri]|uniref:Uncharacterized protein n=1 Tax=Leptomonas seymouri TaxID=5684 RepID=A0A0N0P2M3_LEPSE|nr:hypothetical protein ABL78_8300 [Leptomonas seymouri]|eukprot:KPI82687.1 hypothetical protein ABL78_8300 [Leptomonas seymouri]